MKLSTGKVAIPIEFDNGDKQNIYINPNDPDMIVRLRDMQKNIFSKISEIEDIELDNEGNPLDDSYIDAFEKLQNILKEELDNAFASEVSAVVFKHCSPFAIVEGEYFVVQFIKAITPEVEKHMRKANAEIEKKMSKHIGKYAK